MQVIDDSLGSDLFRLIELATLLTVTLAAVIYIAGWGALLMGFIVAGVGFAFGIVYLKAQLCVKRKNSNARSPSTWVPLILPCCIFVLGVDER